MKEEADEKRILDELVIPKLQEEGYEIHSHPSKSLLPAAFENYIPDAIALRPNPEKKNLAIEIIRGGFGTTDKTNRLAHIFKDLKDWELRVIVAPPIKRKIEQQDLDIIRKKNSRCC